MGALTKTPLGPGISNRSAGSIATMMLDERTPTKARSPRRWWYATATPLLRLLVLRLAVPAGKPPLGACPGCGAAAVPGGGAAALLLPVGRCVACGTHAGAPAYLLEVTTIVAVTIAVLAAPTSSIAVSLMTAPSRRAAGRRPLYWQCLTQLPTAT